MLAFESLVAFFGRYILTHYHLNNIQVLQF